MKPGVQRDLLAAFWLLLDELEIGNDGDSSVKHGATREMAEACAASGDTGRPHNRARSPRRS